MWPVLDFAHSSRSECGRSADRRAGRREASAQSATILSPTNGDGAAALIAAYVQAGHLKRVRQLASDLKEQRPHISVELYRKRSLPQRQTYVRQQECVHEALIQAGVLET